MRRTNLRKCMLKGLLWIGTGILLSGENLAAQDAPISVISHVDKTRMTIGDLLNYTVTVEHDEGIEVEMPGLGQNLGGFEIRDYEVLAPRKNKGRITSSVRYTISTFFTGEFLIPPLTVNYTTADDSTRRTLTTEKIKIIVDSVKPSEAGDIRDIKPPFEIPRDLWLIIRWLILGILILAIFGTVIWLYLRKKAGKGLLPVREIPPRPPHEVALEALDRLRDAGPIENLMEYYIEISEIIRQYIGGRYFLVAMEMTTSEVLDGLQDEEIPDEDYRMFEDFLHRCDLVKFAKVTPREKENQIVLELAYAIVESTKVNLEVGLPEVDEQDGSDGLDETNSVESAMAASEHPTSADESIDTDEENRQVNVASDADHHLGSQIEGGG